MKILLLFLFGCLSLTELKAEPLQDKQQLKRYYKKLFPQLKLSDYAHGVYSLDSIARQSWQAIEEFPPYEPAIESGKQLFETPFKNSKRYADCFENKGLGIAQTYPRWDSQQGKVITLAVAINACRLQNNEAKLPYKKGQLARILAYMTYTSRDKIIDIKVPTEYALEAYEQGKAYYYQRRGQLNFSCASCHIQNAGKHIRAELLSPMLGHTSHWPTYRLKWGEMGTLHRRFIGCHRQIRAEIPQAQSTELRQLEYFLSYISNGIPMNAPSTRK